MIRFDRSRATDLLATFELRVRLGSRARTMPVTLRIDRGRLRVRPGTPKKAGACATIGAGDLVRLALGRVGWPALLASGRLQLTGDPFLALRFPSVFRLPAARR